MGDARRAILLALLIASWGLAKTYWEEELTTQFASMRYRGFRVTPEMSHQLGQEGLISVLGGFRAVVADIFWLTDVTGGFQNEEWYRVKRGVDVATTLQPRFIPFWDNGGWHLAWNASSDAARDRDEKDPLRKLKNERFWIEAGEDTLKRGVAINPDKYTLYATLGHLYQQKLKDYRKAADYYYQASRQPDSPAYLERFPAYMWERAGEQKRAYEHWKMLWNRHDGTPPAPEKALDKIEDEIRLYEDRFNVPSADRVFPQPPVPQPADKQEYERLHRMYEQVKDAPIREWPIPKALLKKDLEKLEIRLGIPKEKRVFSAAGQ
jgi:tetratricopeptide (TPR) repeat protein